MTSGTRQRTIGDLAEVVRSKNAGPFWQTFDIFCADDATYEELAEPGVITPERIGAVYLLDPSVVRVFRLPAIRVIKVSVPRPVSSGSVFDRDVHAGQQHVPLLVLPVAPD